jgi:hypothetical protein
VPRERRERTNEPRKNGGEQRNAPITEKMPRKEKALQK